MPKCPKHHIVLRCPACDGEKHGAQGAKVVNERMTPEQRTQRAQNAAKKRWAEAKAESQ